MTVKTPEQLEDAAIADAVRSIVAIEMREKKRATENKLFEIVKPQVERARLEGRKINVRMLVARLFKEYHLEGPHE